MAKLRVHNISVSVEGYMAGPEQSPDNPLGVGGMGLHEWVFETRAGRQVLDIDGGEPGGIDDRFMEAGDAGIGATIMGRNMFGPIRGPWTDDEWKGWWGDNPPYHHDTFVLTHHARDPITMDGGTTFHFVTDGIEAALARAFESAGGQDVRIGGGASTIQQYLQAGLVDELHLAIVPVLLGAGEPLFAPGVDLTSTYEVAEYTASPAVTHVRLSRTKAPK